MREASSHAEMLSRPDMPASAKPLYTCPMHPEVRQDHPGNCPKCGMTLEPVTVISGADDDENAELRDMTKRFWIGAALALPVFLLSLSSVSVIANALRLRNAKLS